MKKFFTLIVGLTTLLSVGCDPMDDIYDDIDTSIKVDPAVDLVLSSEDYATFKMNREYFESLDEAKDSISKLLSAKYPAYTKGALVNATFNLEQELVINDYTVASEDYSDIAYGAYGSYFPNSNGPEYVLANKYPDVEKGEIIELTYSALITDNVTSFTFSKSDFALAGEELAEEYPGPAGNAGKYGSFDVRASSDNYWTNDMILEAIDIVLQNKYPNATDGDTHSVSYKLYGADQSNGVSVLTYSNGEFVVANNAATETVSESLVANTDSWDRVIQLTEEDYANMGLKYGNFDDTDDVAYKLPILLKDKFPYAEEGDFKAVAYKYYDGESATTKYAEFNFEDKEFVYIPTVKESSFQFGLGEDGLWAPNNTIQYSFKSTDYDLVANELMADYPDAVDNLNTYGNFAKSRWDDDMLIEAVNVVLNNLDPAAKVGQQYQISYKVYDGGTITETKSVVKLDNGSWGIAE